MSNARIIYFGLTAYIAGNFAMLYSDYKQSYYRCKQDNYDIFANFFKPIDEERQAREKAFVKKFYECKVLAKVIFTNENPLTSNVKIDVWQNYLHQLENYSYRAPLRKKRCSDQKYKNRPYKFNHMTGDITQYEKTIKSNYTKTKKMSTTLISQTLKTPLIRHKTVAVAHDIDQCEIKAMMIKDTGTYHRQWVSTNLKTVEEYQQRHLYNSYKNLLDFEVQLAYHYNTHNEVLACLKRESLLGLIIYSKTDFSKDISDSLPLAQQRQQDVLNRLNKSVPIVIYQNGYDTWEGIFDDEYLRLSTMGKVQAVDEYKERLIDMKQNCDNNKSLNLNLVLKNEAIKEINTNLNKFSYFNTTEESQKSYCAIKDILENPSNYIKEEEKINKLNERLMGMYRN